MAGDTLHTSVEGATRKHSTASAALLRRSLKAEIPELMLFLADQNEPELCRRGSSRL